MPDRDNDLDSEEARESVYEISLFIHGVNSYGVGFKRLADTLENSDDFPVKYHRIKVYSYEKLMALSAMTPGTKKLITDSVAYYYHRQRSSFGKDNKLKYPNLEKINIVAHSLGSFGICNWIEKASPEEVDINNLILVGSVVDRNYPWTKVIHQEDKVNDVVNVIGNKDMVPEIARIAGLGNSGSAWFKSNPGFKDTAEKDGEEYVDNLIWNGWHTSYSNPSWNYGIGYLLRDKCEYV